MTRVEYFPYSLHLPSEPYSRNESDINWEQQKGIEFQVEFEEGGQKNNCVRLCALNS